MMFLNCECPAMALFRGLLVVKIGDAFAWRADLGSSRARRKMRPATRSPPMKWIEAGAL
jgi:hypothetical protein